MDLTIPSISISSVRDAGSCVIYTFGFPSGSESEALADILTQLPANAEVAVSDPTNGDCELEVRRTPDGFELKRGCHGAFGTWRAATFQECVSWLLPGALARGSSARRGFGGSIVCYKAASRG